MSQSNNLHFSTTAPIEASAISRRLRVLDLGMQRMELHRRAKLIFSFDMLRYQRRCPLFAQRALIPVVFALLKLMKQLHQCMQRDADKILLSQPQVFFVLNCYFNRFMVLLGFATDFRATFCQQVNNFQDKIGCVKPRFPKSVCLDTLSGIIISCR